jgi:transposase
MDSKEELERKRAAIILHYQDGKSNSQIVKLLKKSNVNFMLVKRTIERFLQTGSTEKRKCPARPRPKRTPAMLKALKARIRRNPRRCQKKLALQMNVSRCTIQRALKMDLKLKALKRSTCHMLTIPQKVARVKKCRALLKRYGEKKVKSILFSDEKIFNVEEQFNKQNDRVYARSVKDIPLHQRKVKRSHGPGSVMVWAGVSWMGKAPLHFVEKGVKVSAKNYLSDVLESVVEPLNSTLFDGKPWTFQQDSAPAHKAKVVQTWLSNNVPDFMSTADWPSASPDLNPLDYAIWSKLEEKVCSKPHTSVEALKKSLVREWNNFPMESVRSSIEAWRPRLLECVNASGGNFER